MRRMGVFGLLSVVWVMAIDGAAVPTRPETAKGQQFPAAPKRPKNGGGGPRRTRPRSSVTSAIPMFPPHESSLCERNHWTFTGLVLETPPLPVTPPQRGDRGHDLRTESSRPVDVQQYNLQPRVAG